MGYSKGKKSLGVIVYVLILLAIFVTAFLIEQVPNRITEEQAMTRFVEITGTTNIEIIRHSNMNLIFGNTHDVTFELKVDGKNISARCTSQIFSPMVCRIYTED